MKNILKKKTQNNMIPGREALLSRGVGMARGVLAGQDAKRLEKAMSSRTPINAKGVLTEQDAKRLEKAFPLRQPIQYK